MIGAPHLPRICVSITNHGDKTGCILGIARHPNIKVVDLRSTISLNANRKYFTDIPPCL